MRLQVILELIIEIQMNEIVRKINAVLLYCYIIILVLF